MLIGNATVVEIEFGLRPQVQKYKTESLRDEVLDFCAAASSSLEDEVRTRAFRPSSQAKAWPQNKHPKGECFVIEGLKARSENIKIQHITLKRYVLDFSILTVYVKPANIFVSL
jgi:hypothetical protein